MDKLFVELCHRNGPKNGLENRINTEQKGFIRLKKRQNTNTTIIGGSQRMKRSMKRKLLIAGILVGSVAVAMVMASLKPEPPKREREEVDMLVDVLELESMSANFTVRTQGTVRPLTETIVSAEVSGTMTNVSPKFNAGGVFGPGETLARIDPTNYTVAVEKAEALVTQRQIEYDGAEKLRQSGYRAEAELASAAAALASAQAELVRARRDLERTYIRLPYEGIVRSRDSDLGQFVNTGTRLGVVFATDFAEVRLPLTDGDLSVVDLPDAAEVNQAGGVLGPAVRLTAVQRGKLVEWDARIVRSEGVVDENSRVTYAVARIEDPYRLHSDGDPLPMGTFVTAMIEGGSIDGIIRVPRTALRGSDELIFVDDESRIRIRQVDIVRSDAEFVYVSAGATPGDRIVVTSLESPVNGTRVRTSDDTEPASSRLATAESD